MSTRSKLLIVVDYQNDFVNGSLGFKEAPEIEAGIVKRIEFANSHDEDVIFTKDIHGSNYLETEEGKNLPIEHCLRNSSGAEFYGRVKELAKGHKVFEKETFPSLELGNYLKDKNYQQVTLIGLVSNICVLSNAVIVKAALPNAHIIVEKDLAIGGDKAAHEAGLIAMKNIHIEIK